MGAVLFPGADSSNHTEKTLHSRCNGEQGNCMTLGMAYFLLVGAILCEVAATLSLRLCEGFTRLVPSLVVVAGYSLAFYLLSFALKMIPVGIAYAIWSGIGMVVIAVFGWIVFKQILDVPAIIGLVLILAGVLVINLFSKTIST